jgi:hypothetical protein
MDHTVETSVMAVDLTNELRSIWALWSTSIEEREASFVDEFMDSNFQYIDFLGNVRDVREYKERFYTLRTWDVVTHKSRDFHVQPLDRGGSCVIVTGQYHIALQFSAGLTIGEWVGFSTVWRRKPHGWKALRHQTIALAPP